MAARFYLSTDFSPARLLSRPSAQAAPPPVRLKRGDATPVHVYFCEDGVTYDPPTETVADIALHGKRRSAATYRTDPVVLADPTVGTDANGRKYWIFTPDWDGASAALGEMLAPDYASDAREVGLAGEISWEVGGSAFSCEEFELVVVNDVVKALDDTVLE